MSFTWQQAEKEKYFKRAEEIIEAAGFTDLLVVDRESFGITKEKQAKVFLKPFHRAGYTRRWWEAKRAIFTLQEQAAPRNTFGKSEKTILIHGFMLVEMEEADK